MGQINHEYAETELLHEKNIEEAIELRERLEKQSDIIEIIPGTPEAAEFVVELFNQANPEVQTVNIGEENVERKLSSVFPDSCFIERETPVENISEPVVVEHSESPKFTPALRFEVIREIKNLFKKKSSPAELAAKRADLVSRYRVHAEREIK